ncbi:MAG TPA: hypothetical protein DCQ31_16020, partial [Bacteroidales bacterium]|nr:hypothetical protein [Bacteroidales bacterium]
MKYSIICFLFFAFFIEMNAQDKVQIKGKVSYKSSQNTYVRFQNTQTIKPGDTLFILKENKTIPALIVTNLSSVSCACRQISEIQLPNATEIIAFIIPVSEFKQNNQLQTNEEVFNPDSIQKKNDADKKAIKQQIRGSLSASSYSQFSNTEIYNTYRFDYRFAISALNIGNSKFSTEANIAFRYKHREWDSIKSNLPDALRIYSLYAKYDF